METRVASRLSAGTATVVEEFEGAISTAGLVEAAKSTIPVNADVSSLRIVMVAVEVAMTGVEVATAGVDVAGVVVASSAEAIVGRISNNASNIILFMIDN